MSTIASLDRTHEQLIDIRLDSLDRVLMDSGVSRSERSEIVQSVEHQIFEMLDQQGEEVTRESVLQILRSLDPPEAYYREETRFDAFDRSTAAGSRRAAFANGQASTRNATPPKHSGLAITSFVLGLLSIPAIIAIPFGSIIAMIAFVFGVIALPKIAASHGRLRGGWMAYFGCGAMAVHSMAVWFFMLMM